MYEFNYHRPTSVADARKLLDSGESARLVAGGMSLLPMMKLRLAQASDLIDLSRIDGLQGIRVDANVVEIGAMVSHADVNEHEDVRRAIPALAHLAGEIGDAQVRNRGTLGGSLAHCDPTADYPAAVLALNATIRTDQREIASDDFFQGMFQTALDGSEIVETVSFPVPKRAAYMKFPNPASRYAVVGVFIADTADGVRVAVTGAGPSVFRQAAMEAALDKDFSAAALDGIRVDAADMNQDLHASAEYRAHLVGVMARRAVVAAGG